VILNPRLAALVTAGVIATACGNSGGVPRTTRATERVVRPPIRAVHRTLRADAFGVRNPFGSEHCVRPIIGPGTGPKRKCKPTAAELARRPASALEPVRVVAELRLHRPPGLAQRALFVVYRSRGAGTCFDVVSNPAVEQLACRGTRRCAAVCLGWSTEDAGRGLASSSYTLVWGLVPARANRLVVEPRRDVVYVVDGPPAPGFPGRRVFLADLGRGATVAGVGVRDRGGVIARATRRQLLRGLR
jgi:hypothetical protein